MKKDVSQSKNLKISEKIITFFKKGKNEKTVLKNDGTLEISKNNFSENIKAKNNDRIISLQLKLKENQIKIEDLTDEELNQMIELYEKNISDKKKRLKQLRNKIFTNQ